MDFESLYILLTVLISIGLNISIYFLILRKSEQASSRITWILMVGTFLLLIWVISAYIQIDVLVLEEEPYLYNLDAAIGNIAFVIALLLLMNFITLLVEPNPNGLRNGILICIGSIISALALVGVYAGWKEDLDLSHFCWQIIDILNLIFMIITVTLIFYDLKWILTQPLSDVQRNQVLNLRNGILIALIGSIPFLLLQRFVSRNFFVFLILILILSEFLLVRAYSIDPRVAFLIPHRTYLVIVVNEHGLLKYNRYFVEEVIIEKVKEDKSTSDMTTLISGALSAIYSMMSEFYQTEVQPYYLAFQKRKILFHWSQGYFVAVFTDQDSMLIRQAMRNTARDINARYKGKVKKVMDDPMMLKLDSIIDKTFYFVY